MTEKKEDDVVVDREGAESSRVIGKELTSSVSSPTKEFASETQNVSGVSPTEKLSLLEILDDIDDDFRLLIVELESKGDNKSAEILVFNKNKLSSVVLDCVDKFTKERVEQLTLLSDTLESYKQKAVGLKELDDVVKDTCFSFAVDKKRFFGDIK